MEINCICCNRVVSTGSIYYLILLNEAEKSCCLDCYDIRNPFFNGCQNNLPIEVVC